MQTLFQRKPTLSEASPTLSDYTLGSGAFQPLVLTKLAADREEDRELTLYTNNFCLSVAPNSVLLKMKVTVLPEVSATSNLFKQFFDDQGFKGFLKSIFGDTWLRLQAHLFCLTDNLRLKPEQFSHFLRYTLTNDGQEYLIELQPEDMFDPKKDQRSFQRVLAFLLKKMVG